MTDLPAAADQAPAPAPDATPPQPRAEDGTFAHGSEEAALGAVWDKLNAAEEPAPAAADPAPAPEAAAADPAPEPEAAPAIEAPTDLPTALRDKWGEIPEAVRDSVLTAHRGMARRLEDMGRVVQAAKPVHDVLVEATKQLPTMQSLTPQQLARDVFETAKIIDNLNRDPVRTLMTVAQARGALPALKAALAGQPVPQEARAIPALMQQVRALEQRLQQVADPAAVEQRVSQTLAVRETERAVADFAAGKPHWTEVEKDMPFFVAKVRSTQPSLSAKDMLDRAYDMAVHANPELRAKALAAARPAPATPDPARTADALKARSVNVPPSRPTNPRPLSEDEALAAIWDKNHA